KAKPAPNQDRTAYNRSLRKTEFLCRPACDPGREFLVQSAYAAPATDDPGPGEDPAGTTARTLANVPWAVSAGLQQEKQLIIQSSPVSLRAISPGEKEAFVSLPAGQSIRELISIGPVVPTIPVTIQLLRPPSNGSALTLKFDVHVTGYCGEPVVCP